MKRPENPERSRGVIRTAGTPGGRLKLKRRHVRRLEARATSAVETTVKGGA